MSDVLDERPPASRAEPEAAGVSRARAAIASNPVWYHTLELAPGVLTPGQVDLRGTAAKVLPDDLSGKRALDIGTFDGFWAFELERRGAEVVAIDVEKLDAAQWPPIHRARLQEMARLLDVELGRGFRLASELRGSNVNRVVCDVLDLTPEAIGGPVDLAFMGALLVHLRDPVRGLERVLQTLRPGGHLYQLEAFSAKLSALHRRRPVARFQAVDTDFNWWMANWATLQAWLRSAGFVEIRDLGVHRPPQRKPMNDRYRGIVSRRPE